MHCSTTQTTMPRWLCGVLCEYTGISNALFNTPDDHAQVALWGVCGTNSVIAQWAYNVGAVRNYRSCSQRENISLMGGWAEESFVLKNIDS